MWRLGLLGVLAAGCNVAFGLDDTTAEDPNHRFDPSDYDLDGPNNFDDNCPGIANRDQLDRDRDGVGDLCDPHPDAAGDVIVERTFFADPAFELERWDVSGFRFEAGTVEPEGQAGATLQSRRSYEDAYVTIELGFEVSVWNPDQFYGGVTIELDDIGGPNVLLRRGDGFMVLVADGPGNDVNAVQTFSPEIGAVPVRMRLSYDRSSKEVRGIIGAEISTATAVDALPPGPFAVKLVETTARLRYLVVYGAGDVAASARSGDSTRMKPTPPPPPPPPPGSGCGPGTPSTASL